jgi:hypothetical protein
MRQPFDRGDVVRLGAKRRDHAGVHGLAVDQHRAGAAIPGVAAYFNARQAAFLAQRVTEAFDRRSGNARRLAIEAERDAGRAFKHQTTPPV